MGFLDEIKKIEIQGDSLRRIVRQDITDDDPEAISTDEFDDANFLDTAKQISKSVYFNSKIRNRIQTLQLGNNTAEYALFKDIFNVFFQKEYQIKKDKTTNVTQLLHRDVIKTLEATHTFSYLKEQLTDNKAKSFTSAGMMAENIIKTLNTLNNNDYEKALKDAQDLYNKMQNDLDSNGENENSSGETEKNGEGSGESKNGEENNPSNNNGGLDSGLNSNNPNDGVEDFDNLPQPVKDMLNEAKEQMTRIIGSAADNNLAKKIENAEKILKSFSYGSQSKKAFIDRNLAEQVTLYENLFDDKKLLQIVNILGQIQHRNQERWDKIKVSKHVKLVEIAMGDDISNLISEEKFNLTEEMLEFELFSRVQENAALVYHSKPKAAWKGPIIFCIDESGSMSGPKNTKAKAIALAMMDIALKQNRKFATVHFDSDVSDVYVIERADKGKSLDMLLEIAGHFSGGGTSFNPPIKKSLGLLENEKFLHNADIVLITDGDAEPLNDEMLSKIDKLKQEKKLQIISILINDEYNSRASKSNRRGGIQDISDKYLAIDDLLDAEEDIFNIAVS